MTMKTKTIRPIEPATMSVGDLADLLSVSPRRVAQLAQEGIIPAPQGGVYAVAPSVAGYCTWLREAPQRGPQSRAADRALTLARLRQITAATEREAAGLVPADECRAMTSLICRQLISRMRALPTAMAMPAGDASRTHSAIDRIAAEVSEKMRSARLGARP